MNFEEIEAILSTLTFIKDELNKWNDLNKNKK